MQQSRQHLDNTSLVLQETAITMPTLAPFHCNSAVTVSGSLELQTTHTRIATAWYCKPT
jgi:hypothetical protein